MTFLANLNAMEQEDDDAIDDDDDENDAEDSGEI